MIVLAAAAAGFEHVGMEDVGGGGGVRRVGSGILACCGENGKKEQIAVIFITY